MGNSGSGLAEECVLRGCAVEFAWLLFGLLAASALTDFVELVSDNEPDPPVAPTIPGAGNSNGSDLLSGDLSSSDIEELGMANADDLAALQDETSYDELSDATYGLDGAAQNADAADTVNTEERIEA